MTANAQLNNILEEAEAAAAAATAAAPAAGNLTLVSPQQQALAPLGTPSLTDFVNSGGLSVDQYIVVKPTGVRIGDSSGNLERIPVTVDMLDVTPLYVCRIEVGGNTTFIKSYNGVTTPQGENFQALVELKTRTPGAKSSGIYQSVEIPAELREDVGSGKTVVEAGTTIGFTPSLTGFKEFQNFFKKLGKTNPGLLTATLDIDLVAKLRTNKNGNEWYVLEFELVGLHEG